MYLGRAAAGEGRGQGRGQGLTRSAGPAGTLPGPITSHVPAGPPDSTDPPRPTVCPARPVFTCPAAGVPGLSLSRAGDTARTSTGCRGPTARADGAAVAARRPAASMLHRTGTRLLGVISPGTCTQQINIPSGTARHSTEAQAFRGSPKSGNLYNRQTHTQSGAVRHQHETHASAGPPQRHTRPMGVISETFKQTHR